MRPNRANTQSSRLKIITVGDINKTFSLPESGATVIFTAATTADRTMTLPAVANARGAKGAYFRFIWGVSSPDQATIIQTNTSAELIKGQLVFYDSNGNDDTRKMTSRATPDLDNDRILTINDDIEPGSMIEFMSDGSHWFISNSAIIGTAIPTIA